MVIILGTYSTGNTASRGGRQNSRDENRRFCSYYPHHVSSQALCGADAERTKIYTQALTAPPQNTESSTYYNSNPNDLRRPRPRIRRPRPKFVGQAPNSSAKAKNSSAKAIRLGFFPFKARLGFLLGGPLRAPFGIPFKVSFKLPVVRPQRKFV